MPEWLADLEPHWAWLSLGVLLAAAEIVAPGFFLIWIGAAVFVWAAWRRAAAVRAAMKLSRGAG